MKNNMYLQSNYLQFTVLTLLLISVLILTGCTEKNIQQNTTQPEKKIVIGIVTPLTGDIASWGQAVREGALLSNKEHGNYSDIIFEDSMCAPKDAVSATQKLINIDGAKIIFGTVCSSETLALAPIAEQDKVILMSIGSSSPAITNAGDYVFRMWPSDAYEAQVLAEYVGTNLKTIHSVDVIYINNDYGVSMKDLFIDVASSNGLNISVVESFDPNANDFRLQLLKVKNSKSQALFVISNPEESIKIFKQIKESGIRRQLFAPGWIIEDKTVLDSSKENIEGIIYAMPNMDANAAFRQKLNATYGEEGSYPLVSALSYDAMSIILDASKKCGQDTECIKSALYLTDYDGASGKTMFDKNGDVINKPYVMKKIINGTITEI